LKLILPILAAQERNKYSHKVTEGDTTFGITTFDITTFGIKTFYSRQLP